MNIVEFLTLVSSEQPRKVKLLTRTAPPELLARARAPGGLRLTDLRQGSQPAREVTREYAHLLEKEAESVEIDSWERGRAVRLPSDLRELLLHANGIHLWANVEHRRSYEGLLPLSNWRPATEVFPGAAFPNASSLFVISYHSDNAAFVTVDLSTGVYYLVDTAGADLSCRIAVDVEGLLTWLWNARIPPRGNPA